MKPNENIERFMVPGGLHDAICYGVVHTGTVEVEFNKKKKMRNLIFILYELPSVTHVFNEDKGEEPAGCSKKFTYTYDDRGNLLDWINTWSNGKINKKNINDLDVENLVGIGCKLQFIEDVGDKGRKYSYAKGVIALNDEEKKTLNKAALHNPIQTFDVDEFDQEKFDALPAWLQKLTENSQEYKNLNITDESSNIPEDLKESEDDAAF